MLLISFHMWHWISQYDRFEADKVEWSNYGPKSFSTIISKNIDLDKHSVLDNIFLIVVIHHFYDDLCLGKGNFLL
jgi:hypothetical protein